MRIRFAIASLSVAALSLMACTRPAPIRTTPTRIRDAVNAHVGREVEVTGQVLRFRDPGPSAHYYVIEDNNRSRVGLRPAAGMERYVGCRATVRGVVGFDPGFGVYIQVNAFRAVCDEIGIYNWIVTLNSERYRQWHPAHRAWRTRRCLRRGA